MYEFDHANPVTVALRVHGGRVHVTAEERSTIEVDVAPRSGTAHAREAADTTRSKGPKRVSMPWGRCAIEQPRVHGSFHQAVSITSAGLAARRPNLIFSAPSTASRRSASSSESTRSATWPNVKDASTPPVPALSRSIREPFAPEHAALAAPSSHAS